jgi:tetratricopeptide (TPR) repeat protein
MKFLSPRIFLANMALAVMLICMMLGSTPLHAQIRFEKYFSAKFLPRIDNTKFLDVKFEWTIPGTIQGEMNAGLTEIDNGDFEKAIPHFSMVIQHSSFWAAYYYRGICHRALGRFTDAYHDVEHALKLNDNLPEIYFTLGQLRQQQVLALDFFALDDAAKYYQDAVDLDSKFIHGYFGLACVAHIQNNKRKSENLLEKCLKLDPDYAPAYLLQAFQKFQELEKKNSEAMALLDRAIAADSTYSDALFWRGYLNLKQNKASECLADWNRLVQLYPRNMFYLTLRGFLYIELDDFDRAFHDLRNAVLSKDINENDFTGGQTALDKMLDLKFAAQYIMRHSYGLDEDVLPYVKKGFCLFLNGKKEEALAAFKSAEEIQPSATVVFFQALILEHLGRHSEAATYYDRALEFDNDIFDAHKKRAVYRAEVKNWKGAYKDYDEMIRLQPDYYAVYRLRGFTRTNLGDFGGAMLDFTKFLEKDTTDAEVYHARGFCRTKLNDPKGAASDYMRALQGGFKNEDLYRRTIDLHLQLKDTASAITALDACVNDFPTKKENFEKRIDLYITAKQWEKGLKLIDQQTVAVDKFPQYQSELKKSYARYYYYKGLIYYKQGNYYNAVAWFKEALVDKEDHEARYYRAKSHIALGEIDRARSDLKILSKENYLDAVALLESL